MPETSCVPPRPRSKTSPATSCLDSRFAGYQLDGSASNTSFDYSNSNIENCFLTAFEAYVRNDLNYKNNNIYYVSERAAMVRRI